jgi:hypothetical protein
MIRHLPRAVNRGLDEGVEYLAVRILTYRAAISQPARVFIPALGLAK